MKTLESFPSENQELLKPVGLDECAALNGGFVLSPFPIGRDPMPILPCPVGHGPIWHGPVFPRPHPVPVPCPVPVSPVHL